jgi:exodeoxyribonuclease VII large subunit
MTGTEQSPWQVREVSARIGDWINRLGRVWIEGQIAELKIRPGSNLAYLTLRDTANEVSLQMVVTQAILDSVASPLSDGALVHVHAAVEWWERRGDLKLRALEIRAVGLGELLAVIDARRRILAAEGLFDESRKKPLPFLPQTVGLISGRGSAAMNDVIENARRRWPAVSFEVREVAVQGPDSPAAVRAALAELDRLEHVDVIVIARGGGSFEDLLGFSDEALVRAVAAVHTPVVSAIGHEDDSPLLDLVADVRASTPTDAARRVVPDVREQLVLVSSARDRIRARVTAQLISETRSLAAVRTSPALRDPASLIVDRIRDVATYRQNARRSVHHRLRHERAASAGQRAQLMALSPQGTLDRGFAVVRKSGQSALIVNSATLIPGDQITIRFATGSAIAQITSSVTSSVTSNATPDESAEGAT